MNSTIVLILQILIFVGLIAMSYFVWRILKKINTELERLGTRMEKFEIRMKHINVGIFLLLVEQGQFSLPEIEKLGKELDLEERVIDIALKRQKLPSTHKPLELGTGDTKQGES